VSIAGVKLPAGATSGQLIAGLEATDDGLDIQFRVSGTGAPPATVDVLSRLGQQPDNSAIAISTDLRGTPVAAQTGQAVATALAGGAFAAIGTGLASALGSTLTVSVIADGANPKWRLVADSESADKARALALAFGLPGLLTGRAGRHERQHHDRDQPGIPAEQHHAVDLDPVPPRDGIAGRPGGGGGLHRRHQADDQPAPDLDRGGAAQAHPGGRLHRR
jgi:hypothetical protein